MPIQQKNNAKFIESVSVREFYDSFKEPLELDLVAGGAGLDKTIRERSLNRPALAMTGYLSFLHVDVFSFWAQERWLICVIWGKMKKPVCSARCLSVKYPVS